MLIDSHAHLTFKEYEDDLEDVIKRSFASETQIINASSNYKTSQAVIQLIEKYDGMWGLVGCHPDDIYDEKVDADKYRKLAQSSKKVIGIGEVGLDFFRLEDGKKTIKEMKNDQIKVFKEFIQLAEELDLPLVLHARGTADDPYGAYDLMLEILISNLKAQSLKPKGVIHCYGGNLEQAKKFIDLGFYIGFTGIVTFKNAKELQEIAKEIPLDKILIETDSPFLAPEPNRGKKNEPSYVKYVAREIANLKGVSFEHVAKQTYENTSELFNL